MRPDIDAGPIERKCSPSNGPAEAPADAGAEADWLWPTSDCAANAATSADRSVRKRRDFMSQTPGLRMRTDYTDHSDADAIFTGLSRLRAAGWRQRSRHTRRSYR